jgi:hypothetical protein
MFSEVLVLLFFRPVVRQHINGGSTWQNKTAQLMARKRKREKKTL